MINIIRRLARHARTGPTCRRWPPIPPRTTASSTPRSQWMPTCTTMAIWPICKPKWYACWVCCPPDQSPKERLNEH